MGKKKQQQQSLKDFLSTETTSNWADEDADFSVKDQITIDDLQKPDKKSLFKKGDYQEPKINFNDLPTEKPFATRIYNIPFTWMENNELLSEFLKDSKIEKMHFIKGKMNKSDFAYVSFEDLDSLKAALQLNGTKIGTNPLSFRVTTENFVPYSNIQNKFQEQPTRNLADKDMDWRKSKSSETSNPFGRNNRNKHREGFSRRGGRGGFIKNFERTKYTNNNENLEKKEENLDENELNNKVSSMSIEEKEKPVESETPQTTENEIKSAKNISFKGRPKLNLKPRSVDKPLNDISDVYKSKDNPFGEGKPRDREDEDIPKTNITIQTSNEEESEKVDRESKKDVEKVSSPYSPKNQEDKFNKFSKTTSFRGRGRGRGRGGSGRGNTFRGRGRGFNRGTSHSSRGRGKTKDGFDIVNNKKSFKEKKKTQNNFENKSKNNQEDSSNSKTKNEDNQPSNPFALLSNMED